MKATIIGLGREGIALAHFLCGHGAVVTVSDQKPAAALGDAVRQLDGLPVNLALGDNRIEDAVGADVLFLSPGVPLDNPAVRAARSRGVPLSSGTKLFLEMSPAPVAAITGSSGKTTTTTLLGEMFRAAGRPVVVAGNIGLPAIAHLDEMTAAHWAVLELSSFQLYILEQSPYVAAITNISPNHLDWHPTFEDYAWAKENIVRYQGAADFVVLNHHDPATTAIAGRCRSRVLRFSQQPDFDGDGAFIRDERIYLRRNGRETTVCDSATIRLRGRHNRDNVLTACALAAACGLPEAAMAQVIGSFSGVEHRLEPVAQIDGATYYNDSIATSPERTIAGLESFGEPIVLLAGGRDKHLPFELLVATARRKCRGVVVFGEMAPALEAAFAAAPELPLRRVIEFDEAMAAARTLTRPGDVVLLSPGGTSFDRFRDFEERGREFKRLVRQMAGATP